MSLQQWALPRLSPLLPLDEDALKQIIDYSNSLSDKEAAEHLRNLLGNSPEALDFISSFNEHRKAQGSSVSDTKGNGSIPAPVNNDAKGSTTKGSPVPAYAPPAYPPPSTSHRPHTNAIIAAGQVRARDEVSPWQQICILRIT